MLELIDKNKINLLDAVLKPYDQLRSYRYFFSSEEWIRAYLEVYQPSSVVLVTNSDNYSLLLKEGSSYHFLGTPFNDFNGICNVKNSSSYHESFLANLMELDYPVILNNIFEEELMRMLEKTGRRLRPSSCVSVKSSATGFACNISKRIKKMYIKHESSLSFRRIYAGDLSQKDLVFFREMLKIRQRKLKSRRMGNYNPSFEAAFNQLITILFSNNNKSIFMDACFLLEQPVAMALYFAHEKQLIHYIRMHEDCGNKISYGLLLDYWTAIQNDQECIHVWDLTRGNASYKYRIGGCDYELSNFRI